MAKNKLQDLRDHLFETIERLKDDDITVERAKAIADLGQTLINTAKLELQFAEAMGGEVRTNFIQQAEERPKLLPVRRGVAP